MTTPRRLDTIGWFICTLHQAIGHDAAALFLGEPIEEGERAQCVLCLYDKGKVTKAEVIERLGITTKRRKSMTDRTRALNERGDWVDEPASPAPLPKLDKPPTNIRRFVLDRAEDVTGMSGTGVVAEGVRFTDGTAALRWLTDTTSTALYRHMDDVLTIHGHDGATTVAWLD